jgi:hypothetical protein
MHWRCAWWRIVQPVGGWLADYSAWLTGLVDLPMGIVQTLNLAPRVAGALTAFPPGARSAIPIDSGSGEVFSSGLWRLVGEGGMAFFTIASGALFGGVGLIGAWYGLTQGYSRELFWYFWGMSAAGIAYGVCAIGLGLREIARLAWRWNAPLRALKRQ